MEDLRQERFLRADPDLALVVEGALEADPVGVASGHERGARGGADRLRHVEVGETNAFPRHPVQVRRPEVLRSKAADVRVTLIVGQDDDDVRPRDAAGDSRSGAGAQQESPRDQSFHVGPNPRSTPPTTTTSSPSAAGTTSKVCAKGLKAKTSTSDFFKGPHQRSPINETPP